MKFSDYKYERDTIESIQASLRQKLDALKTAETAKEFIDAHGNYIEAIRHLYTLMTIVSVRHSINTEDEYYKAEQAFWDENDPLIQEIDNEQRQLILNTGFRPDLEAVYPKTYFSLLEKAAKVFSPEIIEDLQAENKLSTEYSRLLASAQIPFQGETLNLSQLSKYTQDTDRSVRKEASDLGWKFFEEHEAELDDLYDKLVKVRTRMAGKLGYPTFVEMGYDRMSRLDYNQTMVETYRKQIVESVVPISSKLSARQAKRIGLGSLKYYDENLNFLDGNAQPVGTFDQTLQSGKEMYEDLSPETGEFINFMIDNELLDLEAKKGKQGGGFMTFLYDYKAPFIFSNFNGTSGDVDVLTHEAGHAFQGYQSRDIELPDVLMPTYEACEIHSMSMEFITWPYMEKFFGDKTEKYRFTHLSSALQFLPYGVQVDHFQHEIYSNPDWTPAERKAAWKKLDAIYRPDLDFEDNEFAKKGTWWFKQGHIFGSPFYYIDYTLAQVCAFQFWKRFNVLKDETAWDDYLAICKVGGTKSFLEIVKTANLISPFEEGCLESVVQDIDAWLESVDDQAL